MVELARIYVASDLPSIASYYCGIVPGTSCVASENFMLPNTEVTLHQPNKYPQGKTQYTGDIASCSLINIHDGDMTSCQ